MPVHFKTEYKQNYLPVQSRKSASFHPLPEQAADPAGRESTKTGTVMEPPLQRKKRCTGPPTTLSTDFNQFPDAASDDFALLGRNDKFMENVRYKAKSHHTAPAREASPPKQQRLQEKENRRKAPKPTPAPFVDTTKFRQQSKSEEQQPSTPLTPRKEKNESSSLYKEIALREKEAALRQKFSKLDREGGRKTASSALRQSKEQYSKTIDDNRMESAVKSWAKDKNVGSMNEFAQTNLDKGIADSAPEAPADYALRYKTGVSVPRPRRHKFSEYQKSFSWKDGAKASPVLAAEQAVIASESKNKVVYNSNPALVPPQKSFVKDSEYAAQFKQYNAMPVSSDDLKAIPRAEKPRSKVKRSKSTGALRVDKRPAAGSGPLITPDNKRQTIESELQGEPQEAPSSPPIHQGKLKRPRSEYTSNFRSPTKFQYDGAWHGADPPHLQPTREPEKEKPVKKSGPVEDSAPALSNWFAEVIELRRKAAEYKKRAQGTHFSREHLVQLIAQQNQAWDNLSTARSGSSTLSALSLESGASAKLRAQESVEKQKETNLDLEKPVLTNIKQIETECPIKDVSYDYNKIKTMSEGKDGCLIQLPQKLEVNEYRLQTKNLYPDKMENKLFEKQSRKIELSEKPLVKIENIDTNNETLDNELCKGVRKSNDKMQQLKADPVVMETKFNNKLRLETKKESTNHRNVKTKSKKVEMANKIEDDVSLMAHEGSDEEQGKPDFVPEKHMDLTTKQRYKKSQSRKKAWQEMDESRDYGQDDLSLMVQEGSERRAKSRGRKKHRSRRARRREQEEASEVTPDFPSDTGRIPTPKMRSKSAGARHHLDRTTPVVGGAMLSSPPRPEKKSPVKVSRSWCTPQDVYDDEVSTVLSSDRFEPVVGQKLAKTYDVKKGPLATTPTFGLASKDTHFLRDDEVSVDKPLETVFVDSPAKVRMTGNVSSGDEKPARKSKKPTKFEAQRTIKEGYGQTYNKPMVWGIDGGMTIPRIEPDDDVLSLSVRSIASSCSLASEVYERAQKRTQEFWGKNGIASR
ncbi:nuclear protein MDM1 isoform X4 [Magallana gigas]|uniref:nuclear protein MDM1 isoform X4 n=1 Tax=Magallana gigas TaxID=29159 RepID=UPI0033410616